MSKWNPRQMQTGEHDSSLNSRIVRRLSLGALVFTLIWNPAPSMAADSPSIVIQSPATNSNVKGRVDVVATATPGTTGELTYVGFKVSGQRQIRVKMNGVDPSPIVWNITAADYEWSTSDSRYDFSFDTTSWANGTYQITVYVIDAHGFSSSATISVNSSLSNPLVTIISPQDKGVVKGNVSLSVKATADSAGTADIVGAGLKIGGVSVYIPYLNEQDGSTFFGDYFGALGQPDYYWQTTQNVLNFHFDTSSWLPGDYKVSVYVLDSSARSSVGSITLTIPPLPKLSLSIYRNSGLVSYLKAHLDGATSLFSGTVALEASESSDGPWHSVGNFSGPINALTTTTQLAYGTWVRAIFAGATQLSDTVSSAIQLIGTPTVKCTLPSSGKVGALLKGSCTSDIVFDDTLVRLQGNYGSGWSDLGSGAVSGKIFKISISGKKTGVLSVRVISSGQDGYLGSFTSRISKILVKSR